MTITGEVLNSSIEERDLVNKDGTKRHSKISHVLMSCNLSGSIEIVNLRGYDVSWSLPDQGSTWTSPRIKRYECFDGMVSEVSV